jgi:glucose/arabinose dehydrogenase
LMDIVAHPRFATNRLVYLTYSKAMEGGHTIALARGTFNGFDLADVKEIFVTNAVSTQNGNPHTRIAFDREGLLYLAVSHHNQDRYAQDLNSHGGKVLRLRDDGTPAPGNPFLGVADRRPEVFTYGHRALHGIAVHPDTGEVWVNEHGDEVNILKPGSNYGWPFVGLMGLGGGNPTPPAPRGLTLTEPYISWVPALNISGMMFYTGDRFPKWKGNLIVGGLASGQVHRVAFRTTPKGDEAMFTQMREALFTGIGQRVRDVRQGPDGLIYFVAYDDKSGTVRRIEPTS